MAVFITRQQLPRRGHRRSPVRAQAPMAPIVEHDICRPASPLQPIDLAHQPPCDRIRRRFAPVSGNRIPRHWNHPQPPDRSKYKWPPRTKRRPKILHRRPGNLLQRLFCTRQLFRHAARRGERQVRMAPGVIPNQVSTRQNPLHQSRLALREPSHHKERGPYIMLGQQIQQPRRPRRIRTVVEGQRQFPRPARRRQRPPEQLRPRPQRRISAPAPHQPKSSRCAQPRVNPGRQRREHIAIQCAARSR
jgi:hypothetical protein